MIQFNVKSDFSKAIKQLDAFAKQVPFAASVALNKTAKDIQKVEKAAIKRELNNPTASTVKGIRVQYSSKRKLTASVFIVSHVNKFLIYQIEGGKRTPTNKSEAVPFKNLKLNKYGNIAGRHRGKIAKLIARKDTFVGKVKGVDGVWKRSKRGGGLKLLIAFEKSVQYSKRFKFYQHATRTASKRWGINFSRAISQAIRTAR